MNNCRLIQVIETDLELRGRGEDGDPVRRVRQYYSTDGDLLAERDEWQDEGREAQWERCLPEGWQWRHGQGCWYLETPEGTHFGAFPTREKALASALKDLYYSVKKGMPG